MWKITRASINDAEILTELGAATFLQAYAGMMNQSDLDDYVRANFVAHKIQAELNDPHSAYFLAGNGQRNVGYCRVVIDLESPGVPEGKNAKLERIYLDANEHGQGVGRMLFHAARTWAIERGQTGLWLSVWDAHTRGQQFHAKMGFVPIGEEQFQVGGECQRDIVMYQSLC